MRKKVCEKQRNMASRLLSVVLSLVAAFTLMPSMMGAASAGTETAAETLKPAGGVVKVLEYAGEQWYVIGSGTTGVQLAEGSVIKKEGETTIVLLATQNWGGTVAFNQSQSPNYKNSNLQRLMNGYATSKWIGSYYTNDDEKWKNGLVAPRKLAGGGITGGPDGHYGYDLYEQICGDDVTGAILWPLSGKEATQAKDFKTPSGARLIAATFWLRTGGQYPNRAGCVWYGTISDASVSIPHVLGVRPALCLNLTSDIIAVEKSGQSGVYELKKSSHTDGSTDFAPGETITVEPNIDLTKFEDVAVASDSFTFKVFWQDGSDKNIDFTLYRKGGTVYSHGFDKKKLGSGEWQYSAWFSSPEACYIIEKPMEGYQIRYENVGVYAQVTDRCCDGGAITIYKVPKTGDTANLALWMGMVLVGAVTLCGVAVTGKRRKQSQK